MRCARWSCVGLLGLSVTWGCQIQAAEPQPAETKPAQPNAVEPKTAPAPPAKFEAAGQPKPAPAYPEVEDALVVFRRGNVDGALKLLQSAREKHAELPPAEVMLARFCFALDQAEVGKQMLQRAVVAAPIDPEAYLLLADLAVHSNDLVQADSLFERGLEHCATLPDAQPRKRQLTTIALSGLALVAERRQLWIQAEKHLRVWIALDANNVAPVGRLARALFFQKQYDAARAAFAELAKRNSEELPPEIHLGMLYEQTGERELALQEISAAVAK